MPDPGTITLTKDGNAIAVPMDQAGALLAQGYRAELGGEQSAREDQSLKEERAPGVVGTTVLGGLRGASLGLSDKAFGAIGGQSYRQYAKEAQEAHPYVSTGAEILGSFTPIGPAGKLNDIGEAIIKTGEGAGAIGRTAAAVEGGAFIGAGQGAGSYISQTALDDKPLAAEGFVGAMGKGALFGGGASGALSLSADALLRAKALFPEAQVTRQAAQKIDQEASSSVSQLASDSQTMQQTAQQKLQELRLKKANIDLAERQAVADANVMTAQSKLEAQQIRTKAIADRQARAPRRAFDQPTAPDVPVGGASEASVPMTGGADDLMAQLQGTKSALDQGAAIGDLSHMPRTPLVKGVDTSPGAIANASPEAAKLQEAAQQMQQAQSALDEWLGKYGKKSEVGQFERNQATRDYAEAMRPKEAGYYTRVPEGEGSIIGPRGRQSIFRGTAEEQAAAEAKITAKVQPEEQLSADEAIERMFGKKKATGEELAGGAPKAAESTDDAVRGALKAHNGEHADLSPDIGKAAEVIGNAEKAHADMVDAMQALGLDVPPSAIEQAKGYRDAVAKHTEATTTSSAMAASDVQNKLAPAVAKSTGGDVTPLLGKLGKLGEAMEVLHALGVHVPVASAIPVIGPALGLFLKAKAVMSIIGRKGGSVERTAESVIASKAAATRDRINAAVKQVLDASSKAVRGQAGRASDVLGVMSSQLMPSVPGQPAKPTGKDALFTAYQHRMDELSRAQQPGAIQTAIAERVRTSDPVLQQSITEQYTKALQFLDGKAPKQGVMPDLIKGDGEWRPAKSKLEEFARYKAAVDDPAAVLETVAKGHAVSPEAAETLRMVYPRLYAEAQMTLLQHAQEMTKSLPYARRMTLSILFQVPIDGTMTSQHLQFLQAGGVPAAASAAQPVGPGPAAPPHPSLSAPVQVGTRTQTAMDRRAGV